MCCATLCLQNKMLHLLISTSELQHSDYNNNNKLSSLCNLKQYINCYFKCTGLLWENHCFVNLFYVFESVKRTPTTVGVLVLKDLKLECLNDSLLLRTVSRKTQTAKQSHNFSTRYTMCIGNKLQRD